MRINYYLVISTLIGLALFSSSLLYLDYLKVDLILETHSTRTIDGVKVVFDLIYEKQTGINKPIAVTIHGFSSNRKTMHYISLNLAKNGFLVVSVDLRGHGDSEGAMPPLSSDNSSRFDLYATFEKDIEAVLSWLRDKGLGLSNSIVLVGHSMGGGLSIFLGGRLEGVKATIGIAPGLALGFVNSTHPRNLLLIAGSNDKIVPLESVRELFYASINSTGEAGRTYNLNGNLRRFYIDENSDHISVLYDFDVVREVASWAKTLAIGGFDIKVFEPYQLEIPTYLGAIGGLVLIICSLFWIFIYYSPSKGVSGTSKIEIGGKFSFILLTFIVALLVESPIALIIFFAMSIVSPLLMTNFTIALISSGGVGLYLGARLASKFKIGDGIFSLRVLTGEIESRGLLNQLRIGLLYGVFGLVVLYSTVGLNIASTLSLSVSHNTYVPLVFLVVLVGMVNYELYFRGLIKPQIWVGKSTPILSGLVNVIGIYLLWVTNSFLISLFTGFNFWFFIAGFRLMWLPTISVIAISEALHETTDSYTPQIIMASIILTAIAVSLTPVVSVSFRSS